MILRRRCRGSIRDKGLVRHNGMADGFTSFVDTFHLPYCKCWSATSIPRLILSHHVISPRPPLQSPFPSRLSSTKILMMITVLINNDFAPFFVSKATPPWVATLPAVAHCRTCHQNMLFITAAFLYMAKSADLAARLHWKSCIDGTYMHVEVLTCPFVHTWILPHRCLRPGLCPKRKQ